MRRAVGAVLRKDLRVELRTFESVPAMTLFAVTTFVLFHFGLDRATLDGDLAAGVLWVTLLFAAVLGLNRLFVAEEEQGGFDGFLLAPVDRTALFVAKAIALFALPRAWSSSSPSRPSRSCCSGPSPWAALPELVSSSWLLAQRRASRSSARSSPGSPSAPARATSSARCSRCRCSSPWSSPRRRRPRRCWPPMAREALPGRWVAILAHL